MIKTRWMKIPIFNHEKFLSKIIISNNSDCWIWNGSFDTGGYGHICLSRGKMYKAHRVSYQMFFGIKNNYTVIDHKCMNKKCVNPDHLREVTIRVNTIENSSCISAKRILITHCKRGHEFTPENTIAGPIGVYGGKRRQCKTCSREMKRIWYLKNKNRKIK